MRPAWPQVLVWTRSDTTKESRISVDLIEYPRLRAVFSRNREFGSFETSNFPTTLAICNRRPSELLPLLRCVSASGCLLEGDGGRYFVAVASATRPSRHDRGGGTSQVTDQLTTHTLLDRASASWLSNLSDGPRMYLYPVHPSGAFMSVGSLPSAIYLLLSCLLSREYERAFHMIDSTTSDVPLTGETRQIYEQFNSVRHDAHPDASACRLKLILAETAWQPAWSVTEELEEYTRVRKHVSAKCRLSHAEERALHGMAAAAASDSLELQNRRLFFDAVGKSDGSTVECRVVYPPIPPGSQTFFEGGHDDYAWLQNSVSKTLADLSLSGYKRPGTAPGAGGGTKLIGGTEAMDTLHEWLRVGINIRPGKLKLGFLIFYEMITGSFPIKILPTDDPRMLAEALLLTLPSEDLRQTAHISLLRMLCSHDSVSASAPKYVHEAWSLSTVFAGTERLVAFSEEVRRYLDNVKDDIRSLTVYSGPSTDWLNRAATKGHPRAALLPEFVVYPSVQTMSKSWDWNVPRVNDVSCRRRELCPVSADSAVDQLHTLDKAAVAALSSIPMTPIGLAEFVVSKDSKDAEAVSSTLPFDVGAHPDAKSSVAKQMLRRLETDMEFFAAREKKRVTFVLRSLEHSGNCCTLDRAGLNAAASRMQSLMAALQSLMKADKKCTKGAIKDIEALASSANASDRAMRKLSDDTARRRVAFGLGVQGGVYPRIDFELLLSLLCAGKGKEVLQTLNPSLSAEEGSMTMHAVMALILTENRIGHIRCCVGLVADIQRLLTEIKAGPAADEDDTQSRELSLKSKTLAEMLQTPRCCAYAEKGKMSVDPRFLVFEFLHDMMLRKQQHDLVVKFISSAESGSSVR